MQKPLGSCEYFSWTCELSSLITLCTDVSETQKTVGFNSWILQSLENNDMDVTEEDNITSDLFQVSMFILGWFLTIV